MSECLFIVGMGRSGTTIIAETLNNTLGLPIGEETHFYRLWHKWVRRATPAEQRGELSDDFTFMLEQIGHVVRREVEPWRSPTDFLIQHLRSCGPADRPIGEKTPLHLESVMTILGESPDTRVLFVVRDPRDVVRSLESVPWDDTSTERRTTRWMVYATIALVAKWRHRDRIAFLRFEDFVLDPTGTLERACASLGIDTPGASPTTDRRPADSDAPATFRPAEEPWKAKAGEPPDPARAQAWKTNPDAVTDLVGALARPLLGRFGYRTGTEKRCWQVRTRWSEVAVEVRVMLMRNAGDWLHALGLSDRTVASFGAGVRRLRRSSPEAH